MDAISGSYTATQSLNLSYQSFTKQTQQTGEGGKTTDILQFSSFNLSFEQSISLVTDKAFEKLQTVVSDARAALGLPEDAVVDTSPEATADRIANFALGFFGNFQKNNPELEGDEARQGFVDLVGPAIQQGIQEARDILEGLQALTPEVGSTIDGIASLIQDRLDDFLANGI